MLCHAAPAQTVYRSLARRSSRLASLCAMKPAGGAEGRCIHEWRTTDADLVSNRTWGACSASFANNAGSEERVSKRGRSLGMRNRTERRQVGRQAGRRSPILAWSGICSISFSCRPTLVCTHGQRSTAGVSAVEGHGDIRQSGNSRRRHDICLRARRHGAATGSRATTSG